MALAPIIIRVGSILLSNTNRILGVPALKNAFLTGGIRGFARALSTRIITSIVAYFTITKIVQLAFTAIEYLWRFDWNISDENINKQIESKFNTLMGSVGGALGTTIGGTTCTLGMLYIYPQALMFVDEIGGELWEEIASAWTAVLNLGARLAAETIFLNGYKSVRNWLKKSGVAAQILGEEKAKKWGNSRHVVSMAKTWENIVESIKPEWMKQFVEELTEEGYESCKEFALIVANRADQAIGIQKAGLKKAVLGKEQIIEIYPNRDIPSEVTVLAGREELVRAQTVQVLAQHQLMGNRDVGIVIGGENFSENAGRRAPKQVSLIIEFSPRNEKPYFKPLTIDGVERILRPRYEISNVRKTRLDWALIQQACGGINGYMYGRENVTYNLISEMGENRGQVRIYGQTKAEAKDIAKKLIALTDSQISTGAAGEELDEGNKTSQRGNMKPITRVYPYRVTVIVGVDTLRREGRKKLTSAQANSLIRKAVFPLRGTEKPYWWDETIASLFTLVD
ncbi:hypothetical protein NIES2119_08075 [[Phormidium ambiguum] IAM M-71]|uniref:Uncharacterized protein n=1 Tax=[Phormidium ambiguum] IAM M-71 TaxID=454136 RepID=A0A1U7IP13_9CYAN|nr:hypothetical protein [Phormidium ambiguum]OKH39077.1 hypothetical protein NIES2119_08075 [Phormidium ambiguum IAM M-71]